MSKSVRLQQVPRRHHVNSSRIWQFASRLWAHGSAVIATAALVFSLTTLAVKLISPSVTTLEVVFLPGLPCWLATTIATHVAGHPLISSSGRTQACTLMRGLFGAVSITCYYASVEMLPIKDAVTLFFCSPVIAVVLERLVLGEPATPSSLVGCVCTVVGVALVSQPTSIFGGGNSDTVGLIGTSTSSGRGDDDGGRGGNVQSMPMVGVALALSAATANAAAFTSVRLIRQRQSALVLTWWYHTVVCSVSGCALAVRALHGIVPLLPSRRDIGLLALVAASQMTGHVLLNRGFQLESVTRGSAINVLQVLFSFGWGVLVLKDHPNWLSLAGGAAVIAGVACIAYMGQPPPPPASDSVPATSPDADNASDVEPGSPTDRAEQQHLLGPYAELAEQPASAASAATLEHLFGGYERPVVVATKPAPFTEPAGATGAALEAWNVCKEESEALGA